jgi:uncharacterized membrane protein
MLAVPLVIVHSETSYTITGTVVDADGATISGVTLTVYSAIDIASGSALKGDYVKTTKTNNEGYFKLSLDRNSYTLYLEKVGYQTATIAVDLNSATEYTYEIDEITIEKSLSLTTTASTLLIHDGETFSIPLTITNGGDAETTSITVTNSGDYSTSVLNSNNQLVQSISLESDSTASLTLKVVAPTNATDADLTVKLIGAIETDYVIHLAVVAEEDDVLSCTYSGRSVMPSESVDFTVVVANPYYYTKTLQLDLVTLEDWTFYVKNGDGEQINSVTLDAGESVSIHVTGTVPSNTTKGDYSLSLTATYDGKTESLPLTVTVKVESPELEITSKYPSQTVALGATTTYPITLTNPGAKQLVYLKAEGFPSGWTVAFMTSAGVQINSILVDSDSSEELNVEVTPALDSSNAAYEITVVAYSDYTSGKIVLDANIGGSYGLTMSVNSLYFETNAGTTTTDVVTLTNNGYSTLNNLELSITAPSSDWNVTVSPIRVTTLDADAKTTFKLTITPPDDASPQDYLIYVTATSNEVETAQQSIRVTINTESSYSIYGIVLLVIGAGVFVLIYKKLKRK